MPSFRTVDVKGDGSCFFRSLYVALQSKKYVKRFVRKTTPLTVKDATILNEEEFVVFCREMMSKRIYLQKDYDTVKHAYEALKAVDRDDYLAIINSSFPTWFTRSFTTLPKTQDAFRKELAKAVLVKSHWVSQIEVTIMKEILKKELSINLVIFHGSPLKTYKFHKNAVYLINRGEVHYNALVTEISSNSSKKPKKPKKPKQLKMVKSKKECPATHVLNPASNRCVSRTSCKGYEVLVKSRYIKSN